MNYRQQWARGLVICLTVTATLFPGAFYAGMLTGLIGMVCDLLHTPLSNNQAAAIWGAFGIALIPYFVNSHSAQIVSAAQSKA